MCPIAGPLNIDDNGMMDHAVDNSRGNRGITQVVSQLFEINISGNERRALALAVAAILMIHRAKAAPV